MHRLSSTNVSGTNIIAMVNALSGPDGSGDAPVGGGDIDERDCGRNGADAPDANAGCGNARPGPVVTS